MRKGAEAVRLLFASQLSLYTAVDPRPSKAWTTDCRFQLASTDTRQQCRRVAWSCAVDSFRLTACVLSSGRSQCHSYTSDSDIESLTRGQGLENVLQPEWVHQCDGSCSIATCPSTLSSTGEVAWSMQQSFTSLGPHSRCQYRPAATI